MDAGRAMSCEDLTEELVALLDGELPEEKRVRIESHLAECSDCRTELAALRETRTRIDPVLSREAAVTPRFDTLWTAATSDETAGAADGVASDARPPSRSTTGGRTLSRQGGRRGPGRVAGRIGVTLAAAAALALFVYDLVPTGNPRTAPRSATTAPVEVADAVVPLPDMPPELLEHPDMFVDFVIVRRLEKLRQLPNLVDALDGDVGHS